ncbi:enoyl-CoA hydratase/isomerase family protein [Frigidibacter sp. ROC022]|uniref:enoyl-CoA hydratase/isomerase family protein n=1 Tax=Frigidibacter sp. ROC022 TaxID=2971796 RepID=UPI00215B4D84|nr:enoyl-CoA hydratase/isomerase family protein [Frigidibacter sp. ROC022]MCR8725480.1 enoyl-CoA hydratase/isomerase family protein [Frigidibacter sp. ROC022]
MSGVRIARRGAVGRITLTRPEALNALTHEMTRQIDAAVRDWAGDDSVAMLVFDAEGERAFCSGGDIEGIYHAMRDGRPEEPRRFWADEYRLNHYLFHYPKPVAAFLQGFTMGGGVGIGCHGSHRIVGESSRIAMPECGIGLVPDVGGSLLLARAPGRLGEYLGLTGARMGAGDAIHAGFADYLLDESAWPALIARLEETGDPGEIDRAAVPPPLSSMALSQDLIDLVFSAATVPEIVEGLGKWDGELPASALKAIARAAPLSLASALQMIRNARDADDIGFALKQEYRFTYRAAEGPDFPEGIRAQIIDRDRNPRWQHAPGGVTEAEVAAMLAPLGKQELEL